MHTTHGGCPVGSDCSLAYSAAATGRRIQQQVSAVAARALYLWRVGVGWVVQCSLSNDLVLLERAGAVVHTVAVGLRLGGGDALGGCVLHPFEDAAAAPTAVTLTGG